MQTLIELFGQGKDLNAYQMSARGIRCRVYQEDIMQGVLKAVLTNYLNKIDQIFIERNGEISPVKKNRT